MKIENFNQYALISWIKLEAEKEAEKEHIKHHSDFAQAVLKVMNDMIYEFVTSEGEQE